MILTITCVVLLVLLVTWFLSDDSLSSLQHSIKLDEHHNNEISKARLELEYKRGYIQGCYDILKEQDKQKLEAGTTPAINNSDTTKK